MPRLDPVDTGKAEGRTKETFDGMQKKIGMVPNLYKGLANSLAALQAYLAFNEAMGNAMLPVKARDQVALVVGESNGCQYCLSAHSAIGKMVGLTDGQILAARRGEGADPKSDAAVALAAQLVKTRGEVADEDVHKARQRGLSDGEIVEVVALTAINIFTNYFNHLNMTEIDFPKAPALG